MIQGWHTHSLNVKKSVMLLKGTFMKNTKWWLVGMLVMALVLGMAVIGCDNGSGGNDDGNKDNNKDNNNKDSPLKDTTWVGIVGGRGETTYSGEVKFTDTTFEIFAKDFMGQRGSYTTSGSGITMTITQIHGSTYGLDSKWYTKDQLKTAMEAGEGDLTDADFEGEEDLADADFEEEDDWSDADFEEEFERIFAPQTGTFAINGNTLTLTFNGMTTTFAKK
jgi:hypothetical protein